MERGDGLGQALASERKALERYVRSLGATPAEAEDVAATAFLRAVETGQDFRDASAMAAWLRIVARNDWIDAQRRRMRQRAVAERGAAAAPAPSAEERVEADETARALLAAIAELPQAQRTALSLQLFEGLSYAAIAERLGLSVPAVTSLLHRARTSIAHARRRGLLVLAGAWPARWLHAAAQVLPDSLAGRAALPVALVAVGGIAANPSLLQAPPRAVSHAARPAVEHVVHFVPPVARVLVRHHEAHAAPTHRPAAHPHRAAHHRLATSHRVPVMDPRAAPPVERAAVPPAPVRTTSITAPRDRARAKDAAPRAAEKSSPAASAPAKPKDAAAAPAVPPGQAKKHAGSVPPGQAKKADGSVPPGQAKKNDGNAPPGQAKKDAGRGVPPGQAKKAGDPVPTDALPTDPSTPAVTAPAAAPATAVDPAAATTEPDPSTGAGHVPPGQEDGHGNGGGKPG